MFVAMAAAAALSPPGRGCAPPTAPSRRTPPRTRGWEQPGAARPPRDGPREPRDATAVTEALREPAGLAGEPPPPPARRAAGPTRRRRSPRRRPRSAPAAGAAGAAREPTDQPPQADRLF